MFLESFKQSIYRYSYKFLNLQSEKCIKCILSSWKCTSKTFKFMFNMYILVQNETGWLIYGFIRCIFIPNFSPNSPAKKLNWRGTTVETPLRIDELSFQVVFSFLSVSGMNVVLFYCVFFSEIQICCFCSTGCVERVGLELSVVLSQKTRFMW